MWYSSGVDTEVDTFTNNLDNEKYHQKFVESIALQGAAEMERVGPPFTGVLTSWRNAPSGTSWSLTGWRKVLYLGQDSSMQQSGWTLTRQKATVQKRTWGSWWTSWAGVSSALLWWQRPTTYCIGLEHSQYVKGNNYLPPWHLWGCIWLHLLAASSYVHFCVSEYKTNTDKLEKVQRRAP